MSKFSAFLKDEAGAVTVDWVVLTAAIVGLGLLVFSFVRPAVSNVAEQIANAMMEKIRMGHITGPPFSMYSQKVPTVSLL